jgi:hypothetical protein
MNSIACFNTAILCNAVVYLCENQETFNIFRKYENVSVELTVLCAHKLSTIVVTLTVAFVLGAKYA